MRTEDIGGRIPQTLIHGTGGGGRKALGLDGLIANKFSGGIIYHGSQQGGTHLVGTLCDVNHAILIRSFAHVFLVAKVETKKG
jgi:hypothetical protein